MANLTYHDLTQTQQTLLNAAEKAMSFAYSPYSTFNVGAALLTQDNIIVPGANVENAAYGSTICAERSALVSANVQGHGIIKAIAIIGRGEKGPALEPVAPCGSCRQMLLEAARRSRNDMEVLFSNTQKDNIIITTIEALLPYGFGPEHL